MTNPLMKKLKDILLTTQKFKNNTRNTQSICIRKIGALYEAFFNCCIFGGAHIADKNQVP